MKEYTIYLRQGNAKSYTLETYKTIESAKIKLYDIVNLEVERKRPFFVDNDFFENKYNLGSNLFYMCILEREVEDWHKYSNEKEKKCNKNKIIYLYN